MVTARENPQKLKQKEHEGLEVTVVAGGLELVLILRTMGTGIPIAVFIRIVQITQGTRVVIVLTALYLPCLSIVQIFELALLYTTIEAIHSNRDNSLSMSSRDGTIICHLLDLVPLDGR